MQLYLFGGAEIDLPSRSVSLLKDLLKDTFIELKPKSILHVPFARPFPIPEDKGEWDEGWLQELVRDMNIEVLDARDQSHLNKAQGSVVFVNGGPERKNLFETVNKNHQLLNFIHNAEYIVGESAGAMVMGEYMRISREDNNIMKAFGIVKNTVIEPHYTEKNYKRFLPGDMQKSGMMYGVGIDSATAIVLDPQQFPKQWHKLGPGNIDILTAKPA